MKAISYQLRVNQNGSITTQEQLTMQYQKDEALFIEVTTEESELVSGGATTVNFDLNSYLFVIGAGAVFNGGVTTNVVNIAFNRAISTRS